MYSRYLNNNGLSDASEITAKSKPAYDTPFWPFDDAWGCSDWMLWHKKLKAAYGLEKANALFLEAWNKQDFWEWNKSFCKYSDTFFEYFKAQGLEPGNFVSKIVYNAKDTAVNLSKGASSVSKGFENLSLNKVLLIAGLGAGVYFAAPFLPLIKQGIASAISDDDKKKKSAGNILASFKQKVKDVTK